MKSEPGPPMPLGGAAAAQVRFIVWCHECRYQVEPATPSLCAAPALRASGGAAAMSEDGTSADPDEIARRYGSETTVLDWRERLVCSRCGSHDVDMVVTGERR